LQGRSWLDFKSLLRPSSPTLRFYRNPSQATATVKMWRQYGDKNGFVSFS